MKPLRNQTEIKLREILESKTSTDNKVKNICKLMTWDKDKLKESIIKHGTYSRDGIDNILSDCWRTRR